MKEESKNSSDEKNRIKIPKIDTKYLAVWHEGMPKKLSKKK